MPESLSAIAVAFNKKTAVELDEKFSSPSYETKMRKFSRTPQQSAVVEAALESSSPSLLIEAVAGSGKSFTLLDLMYSFRDERSANWSCATLNALGHRAWTRKTGRRRLKLDTSKSFAVAKSMPERQGFKIPYEAMGDVLKLVNMAKNYGLVPSISPKPRYQLLPDDRDAWIAIADTHDLELNPDLEDWARFVLNESIKEAFEGTIDFADQLYMTVAYGTQALEKKDLILIDEAQDLSAIQHTMLRHMLTTRGQIIGAGDRHQAIYGFRGALSDSIPALMKDFQMLPYPLTVSFRCPKAVVREAQPLVPHIESAESSPEGQIIHYDRDNPLLLSEVPEAVLCRNTAPLLTLALRLISAGIGATVLGRDIGKSLVSLIEKVIGKKANTDVNPFLIQLDANIEAWLDANPKREQSLRDQSAALRAIAASCSDTDSMKYLLTELYADNAAQTTLATIHRAKGLEWPEVLFLDSWLIPSTYAEQPWQQTQESNLRYVAITRAQSILHYASSENIIEQIQDEEEKAA